MNNNVLENFEIQYNNLITESNISKQYTVFINIDNNSLNEILIENYSLAFYANISK